ncbi:histidinol-phosphate transaminase [Streptomyces sp. NPDC050619]|uniref:histidinol-phosphate transaminase n=1 Tax=Streptomyces sp. NPDC050619 TaxID=3157214 RepID=UPI0034240DE1
MTNPAVSTAPMPRRTVSVLPSYVAGQRAQSEMIASLASNESHYAPLPSVLDVVAHSAARLNRYPDSGAVVLRERIAEHLGVTAGEVAIGPGSVGVLQQIIVSLCDPGDEVVFAWRSFEAYPLLVTLAGARPVPVPLGPDEGHDLEAMAAAMTDRTRIVLLCTPNNPTGVPITGAAVERFLATVPPQVLVVIDEAYFEYGTDPAAVDAIGAYRNHPNVCVLRTFSKAHGLAGLRVGYAIARPRIADTLRKTVIPFAVSDLAQQAAVASLDAESEMRDRVASVTSERDRVISRARGAGWDVPDSQANFVWIRAADDRREGIVKAFAAADILVRGYAGDGVRITIADSFANDRVIRVLAELNSVNSAELNSAGDEQ